MSFSKKLVSSGAIKVLSNGILDLEGSGSYVKCNELQLTTKLAVAQGGHGGSSASDARSNLGLAIGSDVQAYSSKLADISGLAPSENQYVKWDGSNFVAASLPAGTNYDADGVTLEEADSVFSIKDFGVSTSKLASDAVNESKLSDGAVSSAKLADGAVSAGKLASNAVTSVKINDGAVTQVKLDSTFLGTVARTNSSIIQQESGQLSQMEQRLYEAQSSSDGAFTLASLAIPFDNSLVAEVLLTCYSSDMSEYASFKLSGQAVNNADASSVASVHDEILHRSHHSISAVLDVNGNNMRIRCSPKSSTSFRWAARVTLVKCPKYSA
jgi:hypothetical protein